LGKPTLKLWYTQCGYPHLDLTKNDPTGKPDPNPPKILGFEHNFLDLNSK